MPQSQAIRQHNSRVARANKGIPTGDQVLRAIGYAAALSSDEVIIETAVDMLTKKGFDKAKTQTQVAAFVARRRENDATQRNGNGNLGR